MRILDCTLRDGGYYTNWDFDRFTVDSYINAINELPIEYIEVGYRNVSQKEYLGKFGYTPVSVLKHLRETCTKKIVVMLNEKSTCVKELEHLLKPIQGLVDMVRIAIDPANVNRAVILARAVKEYGFEVGFNCMYMSKWDTYPGFYQALTQIDDFADLFCMVDSFGGVTPDEVRKIIVNVRQYTKTPLGFHGHDNLHLGLINSVIALECGVEYIDATIMGMGRGAGNLPMELLLTYLNKGGLEVNFNVLGDIITVFQPLLDKYRWGTNLPYMLSGANSIPQKEVMEWVTNRTYSFNSIVRAVDNRRAKIEDNAKYPKLEIVHAKKVLIIGGGFSVVEHTEAIREYLNNDRDIVIVFVTARHGSIFENLPNKKYYCLVGNEAKRMSKNIKHEDFKETCILAPYPRTMGTEVPDFAEEYTRELNEINITDSFKDSCTAVALQIAKDLGAQRIDIVGYDGYQGHVLSEKEADLTRENRTLFENFKKNTNLTLYSLTPTLYQELSLDSIYKYL